MSANAKVSKVLYQIGEVLIIKDDKFRSKAFNTASQRISGLTEDIRKIYDRGELQTIQGVGKGIAAVIAELLDTGDSTVLNELEASIPPGIRAMMALEGIGPKKAVLLQKALGTLSIEDLEKAAKGGKVQVIKGFGKKTEANILEAIDVLRSHQGRFLLGAVVPLIEEIKAYLLESNAVLAVEVAGSARRRRETVGDLDILVSSLMPNAVSERFISMSPVTRVVSHGSTRSTVFMEDSLQVDLRVVHPRSYGAALQYFTGSKDHNIKLRNIAVRAGYKLNEYGLFYRETDEVVMGDNEKGIYRALGMDLIPPELRENRGEIEAAVRDTLPNLVTMDDIKGDFHIHSTWSDGAANIEAMAEKALSLGLEFMAICDHTKSLSIANGLNEDQLREQMKQIDRINEDIDGFTILKGTECDILPDGRMDLPNSLLRDLDFVVGSVHSAFRQDADTMTKRILKAIHNENVDCIGHPTGRLIQKRRSYDVNLGRVFEAAAEQGVMMEVNSYPERLDLNDVNCKAAKEQGVKMVIGTDSHSPSQMEFMSFGVSVARRGWLEKENVANSYSLEELEPLLSGN
ncbi:MAG: DNA polymerase/3'-5' exonuclease PolX [Candidatus Bathyarchaeota archaeon]|jgi:DNA polymerase (family 10)|nr:DNA polymerase/3'-5' exonuclease PolX [Candidatus Bathyarchaeota archaeon]